MGKRIKHKPHLTKENIPPETAIELDQLAILLKVIKGNCIVFAVYHSVPEREFIVAELRQRVPFPIKELFLSEKRKDVIGLLTSLDGDPGQGNGGLFLYDLERTFPESLGNLNLQRETLREIPHALIFWVREFALREIAEKAPDFWAWRSEVFDFRLSSPELAEATKRDYLEEPHFYHKSREDLDRRISLFRELLMQQEQEEKPDREMIAYLARKIGSMYNEISEYDAALSYLKKSRQIYRELSDKQGEAEAINLLGIVNGKRGNYQTAIQYFDQFSKICEELGDRAGLARTWWNQGIIYGKRGEKNKQVELWKKSIEMNKKIGIPTADDEKELEQLLSEGE